MATDTQAIKDRIDIAALIGEYVQLKKAGANYKANCPFHNEKSPSFMVHPEKQIWHCFGCGKGGDIFTFIEEMEGLEFVDALKLLAKRAGVEVSMDSSGGGNSLRNKILEINSAAATFFHRILMELPVAEPAREYLERRGLKKQTLIDWQVGFIPDGWDLLTKNFVKKGFKLEDLVSAGLTIKRDDAEEGSGRGYYDRFRGRVMFPISDTHGNVIGFTGRILVEKENSGGKYVNTPETALYEKSRVLYGIHRAKSSIKTENLAVLVEGQMDVISCHQAGMKNVVAASGTALTSLQIKLLKRYTNNISMAFDADNAGIKAGKRGIEIAMEEGMNIKVIQIPDGAGKDADECLKKNPTVWFEAVKNAKGVMDWYFSTILSGVNLNDFAAKQSAASSLLAEIARIPHGVERDEWLKKLGETLSVEISVLREEIKKIKKDPKKPVKESERTEVVVMKKSPLEILVNDLLALIVRFPELYSKYDVSLRPEFFAGTQSQTLYENVKAVYNSYGKLLIMELKAKLTSVDGENTVDVLLLKTADQIMGVQEADKEIEGIIQRLKVKWREIRGRELQFAIAEAERNNDKEKMSSLLRELQSLQ